MDQKISVNMLTMVIYANNVALKWLNITKCLALIRVKVYASTVEMSYSVVCRFRDNWTLEFTAFSVFWNSRYLKWEIRSYAPRLIRPNSKWFLKYIMYLPDRASFSAFYGQCSVTAAWATRSPWSIIIYSFVEPYYSRGVWSTITKFRPLIISFDHFLKWSTS